MKKIAIEVKQGERGWYVLRGSEYLHPDAAWRRSTCDEHGAYTGYFDSEAEAKAALAAYHEKRSSQPHPPDLKSEVCFARAVKAAAQAR